MPPPSTSKVRNVVSLTPAPQLLKSMAVGGEAFALKDAYEAACEDYRGLDVFGNGDLAYANQAAWYEFSNNGNGDQTQDAPAAAPAAETPGPNFPVNQALQRPNKGSDSDSDKDQQPTAPDSNSDAEASDEGFLLASHICIGSVSLVDFVESTMVSADGRPTKFNIAAAFLEHAIEGPAIFILLLPMLQEM